MKGPDIFYITVERESHYIFSVTDDQDSFTLIVEGGLPENANMHNQGSTYMLTWTLMRFSSDFNRTIRIVAKDGLNATALLVPQLQVCACGEGGNCTVEGLLSSIENPLVMNCECNEGKLCYCTVTM